MPRPLIIYYYAHATPSLTEHTYTANRQSIDANDVRNARLIEVKAPIPDKKGALPQFILNQKEGKLHYDYFRPYPGVDFKSRTQPKRGCASAFEAKIYEHLLTKFPENTIVKHTPSPSRESMLIDAKVTLNRTTLKEHFDAFSRLAEVNRVKNEGNRSE